MQSQTNLAVVGPEYTPPKEIIYSSRAMDTVMRKAWNIAGSNVGVMLLGETGTGKELITDYIHKVSGRKGRLVAVNCASIPKSLLESELFGYERGAFTGAVKSRRGKLEQADGGTLFLDEICLLPRPVQHKLLRPLDGYPFSRIGGVEDINPDFRMIAATNTDLRDKETRGKYMTEDVYHRLPKYLIRIPPLRERIEDIDTLTKHFLNELNLENGESKEIPRETMEMLVGYNWPGNVRELKGVIEAAYYSSNGVINCGTLSEYIIEPKISTPKEDDQLGLENMEKKAITAALKKAGGNQRKTARILGIGYSALRRRIGKHNINSLE